MMDVLKAEVIAATNRERHTHGALRALRANTGLDKSAGILAGRLARRRTLGHAKRWWRLIDRWTRHRFGARGENQAEGQPTPDAVVAAWMASPEHRANILSTAFSRIGVGYATDPAGTIYWVQHFGG